MTIKEAVEILNRHKHRGTSGVGLDRWIIPEMKVSQGEPFRVVSKKIKDNLTAFEAIAIAEKYAAGDTPESVTQEVTRETGVYGNYERQQSSMTGEDIERAT